QLWDSDSAVEQAFDDVTSLGSGCRFRDCRHDREPGCAVKAGVDEGRLSAERYESYLKLQGEQAAVEALRDEREQLEAKRRSRVMGKALKAMQKDRGRED
ncbi:MAG TPA: hypothetical protein VMM93_14800, partial [Vicinamibacterales bacterium]|nr:hypothetical protein [Vicinamibacterales bacterium]